MKRMNCLPIFLLHFIFVSSTKCMDLPKNEDQKRFNHLVRSHQFDAARAYVREDFLTVNKRSMCPLSIAIYEHDYLAASFLLSSLKMKYDQWHYSGVSTKKMAKLLMNQGTTDEDKDALNVQLLKRMIKDPLNYQLSCIVHVIGQILDINMHHSGKKNTFLHEAVNYERLKIVEALLQHPSINVHERTREGDTPFELAIKKNISAPFNKVGMFFWPVVRGNPFAFQVGADHVIVRYNRLFLAQLFCAARSQEKKMLQGRGSAQKKAFDSGHGIMCNSTGYYFFNSSMQDLECWAGKKVVDAAQVQLLSCCLKVLQDMKDPSLHYFQGAIRPIDFYEVVFTDHNAAIKSVIKHPFVLFYDTKIAFEILLASLKAPNQESFKYIIENLQPDLSLIDEDGNTLLHHAVMLNESWIAELLIKKGIDFFARNKNGKSALDNAQAHRKEKCTFKMMQAFGQKCIDSKEYTQKNIKRYIQEGYLLRELKWVSPGEGVDQSQPLLHAAVRYNHELCRILLKAGAPADAKNFQGKTALQYIVDVARDGFLNTYIQPISLLLHYGAQVTEEMLQRMIGDEDLHAVALNAWKKQEEKRLMAPECCICFESDIKLSGIKCENKHTEFICTECSGQIKTCPLCRKLLQ